ncbi:cutinase [Polyplosphaeria fusca]|uniref:Cutinase n=1 Tax=Polyplosphaeria fusca TaxID=682080 RepID=A0A9P4UYC4_9PLEO|nr:cutinase [Polyplosphaeria fusca]
MYFIEYLFVLLSAALLLQAAPLNERVVSSKCPSYTIINTRGTSESQGQSSGFRTMNSRITSQLSGGKIYSTRELESQDIIDKISSTMRSSPKECFVLQGYSQGAAATVNALAKLTGASFDAIMGVFLIGDPLRKSGLSCNVDNNGGTTTRNVNGLSAFGSAGIPSNWQGKMLEGDGVCDTTQGAGINAAHLQYSRDSPTQNLGTSFTVKQLGGSG